MYKWIYLKDEDTIPLNGDIYVTEENPDISLDERIVLIVPFTDTGLLAVKINNREYQVTNRVILDSLPTQDSDPVLAAIVQDSLTMEEEVVIPGIYEALFASIKRMSLLKPHNLQKLDEQKDLFSKFDVLASIYLKTKDQRFKYLTSYDNIYRYNLVFKQVLEKNKIHPAKLVKGKDKTNLLPTDQVPAPKEPEAPKTFSEKILALPFPDNVRSAVTKELERLDRLNKGSQEHAAALDYIEWAGSLPWGVYTSKDFDLMDLKRQLDSSHYGLADVKTALLEHFCIEKIRGQTSGHVLCFNGPAGTGKTTIAKQIAEVSGRPLIRLALGGLSDEAELRG